MCIQRSYVSGIASLSLKHRSNGIQPRVVEQRRLPSVDTEIYHACVVRNSAQKLSFKAFTGNTLTIFLAGLAFTVTILPNASLLPALVAALCFRTTRQMPGRITLPLVLTAFVTTDSNASTTAFTSFFATPLEDSRAAKVSLLVITLLDPPFMLFIAARMAFTISEFGG